MKLFLNVFTIIFCCSLSTWASPKFSPCDLYLLTAVELGQERLVGDLAIDPFRTYQNLLKLETEALRQGHSDFYAQHNSVLLLKIIADLNERLSSDSVLQLDKFRPYRKQLIDLRERVIAVLNHGPLYHESNQVILEYVEKLDSLFRFADPKLTGTYHRDIAGPELKELMKTGDSTFIFFTFNSVDNQYFWQTRSAPVYLHGIIQPPPFLQNRYNYKGGPLVDRSKLQLHIDGYPLDLEEFTKHDAGHSAFMKRRDHWLFQTTGFSKLELVEQWTRNRTRILKEQASLAHTDDDLAKAVGILLTEVLHERGYQYYLPFLRQQLATTKWAEVVRKKVLNNYWGSAVLTAHQVALLEEARIWLWQLLNQLMIEDNMRNVWALNAQNQPVLLKHWYDIETYQGRVQKIILNQPGSIKVEFLTNDSKPKITSLFEVSLAQIRVNDTKPIISVSQKHYLEKLGYSRVEIFKIEQVATLIQSAQQTEFTITHEPQELVGVVTQVLLKEKKLVFNSASQNATYDLTKISIQPLAH